MGASGRRCGAFHATEYQIKTDTLTDDDGIAEKASRFGLTV